MVILDNSRTLGAFERQSRILHILFIIFIFASDKYKVLIILILKLCLLFNQIQSKLLKRIL